MLPAVHYRPVRRHDHHGRCRHMLPTTTGGSVCAVVLAVTPNKPPLITYVLGAPFMAKFPSTFFGQNFISSTGSRGVPLAQGPALGGGQNGMGPEDDVCIYGTVPVRARWQNIHLVLPRDAVCSANIGPSAYQLHTPCPNFPNCSLDMQVVAVCAPPLTLQVNNPATCQDVISAGTLLGQVSLDNKVAGFVQMASATQPMGPTSTTYSLQPPAPPGGYAFPGGQTSTITLTASTPTVPASVNSCQTTITVPLTKPTAVCAPTLNLAATQGCAAHPAAAALMAAVNMGSSGGSGGPLSITLNPPAPTGGVCNLPVGTYPISLTVSSCAGTHTCSTLLTVSDQEQLTVRPLLQA